MANSQQIEPRGAASALLSDAEISDAVASHAPGSWEIEDYYPEDLRQPDELAADDAGVPMVGEF